MERKLRVHSKKIMTFLDRMNKDLIIKSGHQIFRNTLRVKFQCKLNIKDFTESNKKLKNLERSTHVAKER